MNKLQTPDELRNQRVARHQMQVKSIQNLQSQVDTCTEEQGLSSLLGHIYNLAHQYFYYWNKMPSYDGDGWTYKDTQTNFYKLAKEIELEESFEKDLLRKLIRSTLLKLTKLVIDESTLILRDGDLLVGLTQVLNKSVSEDKGHYWFDRDSQKTYKSMAQSIDFFELICYSVFPYDAEFSQEEEQLALALSIYLIKYSINRRKSLPESDETQLDTVSYEGILFYRLQDNIGMDKALLLIGDNREG